MGERRCQNVKSHHTSTHSPASRNTQRRKHAEVGCLRRALSCGVRPRVDNLPQARTHAFDSKGFADDDVVFPIFHFMCTLKGPFFLRLTFACFAFFCSGAAFVVFVFSGAAAFVVFVFSGAAFVFVFLSGEGSSSSSSSSSSSLLLLWH